MALNAYIGIDMVALNAKQKIYDGSECQTVNDER